MKNPMGTHLLVAGLGERSLLLRLGGGGALLLLARAHFGADGQIPGLFDRGQQASLRGDARHRGVRQLRLQKLDALREILRLNAVRRCAAAAVEQIASHRRFGRTVRNAGRRVCAVVAGRGYGQMLDLLGALAWEKG